MSEHSIKNFIPENYELVDILDNQFSLFTVGMAPEAIKHALYGFHSSFATYFGWNDNGNHARIPSQCEHCGTHIRYVSVLYHAPTDSYVCFGADCARRIGMTLDEHKVVNLKKRAKGNTERGENFQNFQTHHPEAAKILAENSAGNEFLTNLLHKVSRGWVLSEKQIAAILKSPEYAARKKAREEEWARKDELRKQADPIRDGRYVITGTIVSLKIDDFYDVFKILVEREDFTKVWGSLPRAILNAEKGDKVRFTATVKRSDDDPQFGFYKRPAKASIVRKAETVS